MNVDKFRKRNGDQTDGNADAIDNREVGACLEEASKHWIQLVEAVLATAQVQCP